ncbi:DUF5977 domain-containing protein [[Flexibacter] sp. ATCC 35208]|uniref:DUF5977 domain-containing protein n=1 Tax=[Flexibacter] sp. ATCC 35208 TaxID=1936242 RepID=UPI0009CE9929|nr:DUF5977 domain-containing protein [[Flexibacter] sp. ATCC 35208]OMP80143.1 hypothetical protein BW716_06520 [[Flexibacter] sp. ATCC 35208]
MKKILLSLLLCFITPLTSNAQDNPIVPLPADQAELFKYTSTPVSLYTGVPQIAYPIYEINTGKIKVPISLSYHASGIKVGQKATWVGLGWTCMPGGNISRSIRGIEDETTAKGWFNHYINIDTVEKINDYYLMRSWGESNGLDLQPDFFNLSIPGKSCRFFYSRRDKKFVTAPYQPVVIKRTSDNNYQVTDDDGTRYAFEQKLYSFSDNQGVQRHIVSWNLTSIISNDSKDTVTFSYVADTNSADRGLDETRSYTKLYHWNQSQEDIGGYKPEDAVVSYSYSYSNTPKISEITFRQGKVKFYANTLRKDYGGNALDSIVVYSKDNGSYQRVKKATLAYDYFYDGNSYPSFSDYRLKLLSFTMEDMDGQQPERYSFEYDNTQLPNTASNGVDWWGFYNGNPTQFTLLPQALPEKEFLQNFGNLGIANREPSASAILAGTLNKVTYPTGGYTKYNFGISKYYDVSTYTSLQKLVDVTFTGLLASKQSIHDTSIIFQVKPPLNKSLTNSIVINIDYSTHSPNSKTYAQVVELYDLNLSTTEPLPLNLYPKGDGTSPESITASYNCDSNHTYKLRLYIDDYITTSIKATISMSILNQVGTSSMGGGIRIESIESYNLDNTLQKKEVYKYGASQNEGGTLLIPADEIRSKNYTGIETYRNLVHGTASCIPGYGYRYTFYGQSYYPSVTFQGANVVYNYIYKYEYNNDKPNGLTMYQYALPTDYTTIANPSTFGGKERVDNSLAEDLLLDEKVFRFNATDSTFDLIKWTNNSYGGSNFSVDTAILIYTKRLYLDDLCGDETAQNSFGFSYIPLKSGGRNLASTTVREYDNNGTLFENVVNYTYNSKNYPKSVTRVNSKSDTIVSKMYYPGEHASTDGNASILNSMVYRNMIRQPYWQGNYTNGTLLSYKHTLFGNSWGTNDSLIAPKMDSSWQLGNDNSLPATTIAYQSYGPYGNIRQIRDDKGITAAYTWTADGTYPVSQTAGAALNQVLYDGFEDISSWTGVTRDATVSHTGKYAGLISGASTYINPNWLYVSLSNTTTFRFSGWVYSNGPSATINLLSKTSATSTGSTNIANISTSETGKWVYIEKEYSVPSGTPYITISLTNNGSGKVWFDDIKLRPSASQMSTYTFDPLKGMTSKSDEGNHTLYYEFDGLNRLKLIRNKDRNILKMYCYNYAGEIDQCDGAVYYNDYQSQNFTKTCSSGSTSIITYAVEAGRYASRVSVADANSKALADITANGQSYANKMGDCSYYLSEQLVDTFYSSKCTNGGISNPIEYRLAGGTDTSYISQDDANAKAQAKFQSLGQAYADLKGNCGYYNTAQTGSFQKTNCTDSRAEGSWITATIPANTYYTLVSLDSANAVAKAALKDSGTAQANRLGICYYFSDEQKVTKTKACDSGYVGTDVTYVVAARHDSTTISKDTANAIALRYANANAQSYANTNGTCQTCNLLFSKKAGSGSLNPFSITVTNTTTGAVVYQKTFSPLTDEDLKACAIIPTGATYTVTMASTTQVYITVNGTTKTITANGSQTWTAVSPTINVVLSTVAPTVYSSGASSGSYTKTNCTGDSTGVAYIYTLAAGLYTSTISQADANAQAQAYANQQGPIAANQYGYCIPSGKNFGVVVKRGATVPGTLSIVATNNSTSAKAVNTTAKTDWPYYTTVATGVTYTITMQMITGTGSCTASINGVEKTFTTSTIATFTGISPTTFILVWKN